MVVFLILIIGIFVIAKFYSGDYDFVKLSENNWIGNIGKEKVNVKFLKGSREVKGYTYGYIEVYKKDKLITREHIKYKDRKIKLVEKNDFIIDLTVDYEKQVINGNMNLKELKGKVLLKNK